jgi:hypothetical protein
METMNPEQQRIAIAKACGWLQSRTCHWGGWWYLKKGKRAYQQTSPDYLNDLNAMAAAESIIIKAGAQTIRLYEDALQKFVANIVFATASQRAEAFLRTLNLWKP